MKPWPNNDIQRRARSGDASHKRSNARPSRDGDYKQSEVSFGPAGEGEHGCWAGQASGFAACRDDPVIMSWSL